MCARPPLIRAIDPSLLPFGVRAHTVRPYMESFFTGILQHPKIDFPASQKKTVDNSTPLVLYY